MSFGNLVLSFIKEFDKKEGLTALIPFVVAFPDLGGCEKWQKTASALDFPIIFSDYLEKNATGQQRKQGLDIADFL